MDGAPISLEILKLLQYTGRYDDCKRGDQTKEGQTVRVVGGIEGGRNGVASGLGWTPFR